ncbi:sensor histidine kinase [Cohnella sp.]|uniref:cache domain-containing sensor histidine kinase n=1 Tax=Cohnella sp. TaxID=1883426 RepID=UPI00356411A8
MSINSYQSSQKLLENKYTDLLIDISKQSNIRIEEFLNEMEKISLVSSYGINSYVSATSQENYPIQNYLRESNTLHENQASRLLMNYITMKDRAFSAFIYNLNGGKDLYISSDKPIDYNYNPRGELWFENFLKSEAIVINVPTRLEMQTKSKDNWAILNVRKIFDLKDGRLLGVMVISVDLDFINRVNEHHQEGRSSAFTIVDENGLVIYNSKYEWIGKPFTEVLPLDSDLQDLTSGGQIVQAGGKDYILIHNPFEEEKWTTYLYMPLEELSVEGDILKRNLLFIALMLIFFAIISSYYLSNIITRPIKKLMRNMTLVEKGKFDNLPAVQSNDEIGLLANRFELMSSELKQLVERIYKEEEEKSEAEMRALQAQINPHFLYNTLNSVKWIASMQGSEKIVDMTEALISMLRYTTSHVDALVTIREEMENIEHYVTIQKVRYFNRINVAYEVDETTLNAKILKLSIQPIIENAIFHGIAEHEEEGTITIRIYRKDREIVIAIHDNGKGMDEETIEHLKRDVLGTKGKFNGIGISNVHSRIQRIFGLKYGIHFVSEQDKGTTFFIRIPEMVSDEREII